MNQKLIDFIASSTHLSANEVKPELRLAEDLGFYGLDSIAFFEEFVEHFGIENMEEFDLDLHIDGGPDFVPRPINWIKNMLIKERRKYLRPDVTLGHLEKVIEAGAWFNER